MDTRTRDKGESKETILVVRGLNNVMVTTKYKIPENFTFTVKRFIGKYIKEKLCTDPGLLETSQTVTDH